MPDQCPGPLVWFSTYDSDGTEDGAILECATCSYLIVTGSFLDTAHVETPLLREGV